MLSVELLLLPCLGKGVIIQAYCQSEHRNLPTFGKMGIQTAMMSPAMPLTIRQHPWRYLEKCF